MISFLRRTKRNKSNSDLLSQFQNSFLTIIQKNISQINLPVSCFSNLCPLVSAMYSQIKYGLQGTTRRL